jgi:16S rRNA (adenine1518-N6/adenine1519-N6)-dimethyltransferase
MTAPFRNSSNFPSLRQKKRLSQVFLKDYSAVSGVFDELDLKGKTVLEIGAGTGIITRVLSKKARKVVALEIDPDACGLLRENLSNSKNVEILCVDALQASFNYPVIIGFLPYHISSPLLFKILSSNFKEAIVCVQKEFASRMVAEPGSSEYSRLSVMAQNHAEITYLATVPKEAFSPIPKVDSALVYLVKNPRPALNAAFVSALFQHKNQSVRKALKHSRKVLKIPDDNFANFLLLMPEKRTRLLTLGELRLLSKTYEQFIISGG